MKIFPMETHHFSYNLSPLRVLPWTQSVVDAAGGD